MGKGEVISFFFSFGGKEAIAVNTYKQQIIGN